MKNTIALIGSFVALALATPAHAGGVIIDGWEVDSMCQSSCVVRTNDDDDDNAQEIYLLAAFVFNGHAAAAETENDGLTADDLAGNEAADESEIVVDDPDAPLPTILDEVEGDELGGCAAAPGGLAALAGLLLFRRRRR